MAEKKIEIIEDVVRIHDLEIQSKQVADYLKDIPEGDQETILVQAVEVGILCLERARTSQDIDFVKRQVQILLADVEKTVKQIPESVQKELVKKVGTDEGQILAPISSMVKTASGTMQERINEVKKLLVDEIDPAKDSSTLGRALKQLKDLLDEKRTDSIQGSFQKAIKDLTGEEGAMVKTVKSTVLDAMKPLADEVNRLNKDNGAKEAVDDALDQTPEKGNIYETQIVNELQPWAKFAGAEIEYVGTDNKSGDIIVTFQNASITGTPVSVVIEAKNQQKGAGRKPISDAVNKAMVERKANAAVYLSHSKDGLGKEIGEWGEGTAEKGAWVATTHDHLTTAIRFLVAQQRIASIRASKPEIDISGVESQITQIRTALTHVGNINGNVTTIRKNADAIQTEAEALRDEIRGALLEMEDSIRTASNEDSLAIVSTNGHGNK